MRYLARTNIKLTNLPLPPFYTQHSLTNPFPKLDLDYRALQEQNLYLPSSYITDIVDFMTPLTMPPDVTPFDTLSDHLLIHMFFYYYTINLITADTTAILTHFLSKHKAHPYYIPYEIGMYMRYHPLYYPKTAWPLPIPIPTDSPQIYVPHARQTEARPYFKLFISPPIQEWYANSNMFPYLVSYTKQVPKLVLAIIYSAMHAEDYPLISPIVLDPDYHPDKFDITTLTTRAYNPTITTEEQS